MCVVHGSVLHGNILLYRFWIRCSYWIMVISQFRHAYRLKCVLFVLIRVYYGCRPFGKCVVRSLNIILLRCYSSRISMCLGTADSCLGDPHLHSKCFINYSNPITLFRSLFYRFIYYSF